MISKSEVMAVARYIRDALSQAAADSSKRRSPCGDVDLFFFFFNFLFILGHSTLSIYESIKTC